MDFLKFPSEYASPGIKAIILNFYGLIFRSPKGLNPVVFQFIKRSAFNCLKVISNKESFDRCRIAESLD